MIIQYTNTALSKQTHPGSALLVFAATLFFIVPASLIVLGYYASLPTGTLLSPLPDTVIGETPTPTPTVVIAADKEVSTATSSSVVKSNSDTFTAIMLASLTETVVRNPKVTTSSQIALTPKTTDKSTYFVKSKGEGFFTISSITPSDTDRLIDYQVVAP